MQSKEALKTRQELCRLIRHLATLESVSTHLHLLAPYMDPSAEDISDDDTNDCKRDGGETRYVKNKVNRCDSRCWKDEAQKHEANDNNLTPIMVACDCGVPYILSYLLSSTSSATAISLVAERKLSLSKRLLIGSISEKSSFKCGGNTALHYACNSGNLDCVNILLSSFCFCVESLKKKLNHNKEFCNKCSTAVLNAKNVHGDTPLMMAVAQNHLLIVNRLVFLSTRMLTNSTSEPMQIIDFNARNKSDDTALSLAYGHGYVETTRVLLSSYEDGRCCRSMNTVVTSQDVTKCSRSLTVARFTLNKLSDSINPGSSNSGENATSSVNKEINQIKIIVCDTEKCLILLQEALVKADEIARYKGEELIRHLQQSEESKQNCQMDSVTHKKKKKKKKKSKKITPQQQKQEDIGTSEEVAVSNIGNDCNIASRSERQVQDSSNFDCTNDPTHDGKISISSNVSLCDRDHRKNHKEISNADSCITHEKITSKLLNNGSVMITTKDDNIFCEKQKSMNQKISLQKSFGENLSTILINESSCASNVDLALDDKSICTEKVITADEENYVGLQQHEEDMLSSELHVDLNRLWQQLCPEAESLCIDVSKLLLTPHGMAMDLSPSQLEVVTQLLRKQLAAASEAKRIHSCLLHQKGNGFTMEGRKSN